MPTIYAFGKATNVPTKYDFYDAIANTAADAAQQGYTPQQIAGQFSNNPFGVSYQEILGSVQKSYPTGTPPAPKGAGAAAVSPYEDKSNDITLQNAGLGGVNEQEHTGVAGVDKALGNITGMYDTEAGANEGTYQTGSETNQSNLQRGKQTALLNAAQGRRGLVGTLASLGALSGSGIELADRAVQAGANEDLSGAADTFAGNQSSLDTSIGGFRAADKERRQEAATAAENAKTGVHNQAAKDRMTFFKNLSDDYAAEGNSDMAKHFTDLAAGLYGQVANTSVPSSNLAYTGAAFTAPTLSNYLTGANNTQVSTAPATPGGSGIPGLVANNRKKLQPA